MFLASGLCFGHGTSKGDLVLDHPYATPSLAGVNNGSAYLRGINNKGDKPDRLVSASSPVATARVSLVLSCSFTLSPWVVLPSRQ